MYSGPARAFGAVGDASPLWMTTRPFVPDCRGGLRQWPRARRRAAARAKDISARSVEVLSMDETCEGSRPDPGGSPPQNVGRNVLSYQIVRARWTRSRAETSIGGGRYSGAAWVVRRGTSRARAETWAAYAGTT